MDKDNPRDYGMPGPEEVGIPKVLEQVNETCPLCKCKTLYRIEIAVKMMRLRTGVGVGTYIGCPACPWASPMMNRAV